MDYDDSRSLLKTILGIFARRPPEKPAPASSLRSQALDAWVRTDAYLQHETNDFEGNDPEQLARTLTTLEDLVQYDCDPFQDLVSITWVSMRVPLTSTSYLADTRLCSRLINMVCRTQSFNSCAVGRKIQVQIQARNFASVNVNDRMMPQSRSLPAWMWKLRDDEFYLGVSQTQ